MFSEFKHDFGTVARGDEPEFRFKVQNIYLEDIEIDRVSSSCGCATVSYTEKKMKTWETSEIVVKFNSKTYSGFRQATISVNFEKPFRGEVQLTIQGNIRTDIAIEPSQLDFGNSRLSRMQPQTVRVVKFGNPNWTIHDVRSGFSQIGVELSQPQRYRDRVEYNLKVTLKDGIQPGYFQGQLFIVANENNREVQFPVAFSGKLRSPLDISPQVLDFDGIAAGQTVSRRVVLEADEPFAISDVVCEAAGFACEAKPEPKKVHFLEIKYTNPGLSGNLETQIVFVTNLNTETKINLPVMINHAD